MQLEQPMEQQTVQRKKRRVIPSAERAKAVMPRTGRFAPLAVAGIVVIAVFVMLILMSYAKLVIVNDDVITLRNQLTSLQTEQTKLMAQYELSYDLQDIEAQMLASGQMTKVQGGQIYTLELAEPDHVEYYKNSGLTEMLTSGAKSLVTAIVEYF